MAVCTLCGLEMRGSASCVKTPIATERGALVPIANGSERRMSFPGARSCDDCGVARGGFHHRGCDLEECPCCGCQLISCGCLDPVDELDGFDRFDGFDGFDGFDRFDDDQVERAIDDRDRLEYGAGRTRPTGDFEDARNGFDVLLPIDLGTGVLALTAAVCNDRLGQERIRDVLKGAPTRYGVSVRVIPTSGTFDPIWYLDPSDPGPLASTWYSPPPYDPFAVWRRDLEALERAVGGREALDGLDPDTPLPDEPFDWTGVPEDVHDTVATVLQHIDSCAATLFDDEFRTVCRRLLARVCTCDAGVIRRNGSPKLALALCWLAARANLLFTDPSRLRVRDLTAHFGIAEPSSSSLANALMRAGGFDFQQRSEWPLGSPRYLTSGRRRQIATERDACRAKLRPH